MYGFRLDSESVHSFKENQVDSSSRPDALYLANSGYASGGAYVSVNYSGKSTTSSHHNKTHCSHLQAAPAYGGQEFEQKITPSSHCSTLRRNDNSIHQQPPPIYDSIATKMGSAAIAPPPSGAGQFMGNHMNTMMPGNNRPVEYASFDRNTLDYRHAKLNQQLPPQSSTLNPTSYQQNHVEMRQHRNGISNDEYRLSAGSDLIAHGGGPDFNNLSNSSIANQLSGMGQMTVVPPPVMPRGNAAIMCNNSNKDNNRSISSRNHIITDTLPGPESCV